MQPALILLLFRLGALARLAALGRGVTQGLLKRYPCFFAMAALSFARAAAGFNGRQHPYTEVWYATQWPMAILQIAAAIEAFWILALHFRGIRNFGRWLLGAILIISAVAAGAVGAIHIQWDDRMRDALRLDQVIGLFLLLTACLSVAFFRQFRHIPIRPNARHHLTALTILFGLNFVGFSLGLLREGQWKFATSLVIGSNAVLAYSWWALTMTREGENLPFDPPVMSDQDYDAAEAVHKQSSEELKQAGAEALKKTFRS